MQWPAGATQYCAYPPPGTSAQTRSLGCHRPAFSLNFTQAAAQVHLSQPALSAAVLKLEDVVGGRLLDRDTRNVALTPLGAEVFATSGRLLADFDAAFAGVRAFLGGRRGRVGVAASPSLSADFLPEVVAAFQRTHPLVELQVHDALSDDAISLVRTGKADLALAPEPESIEENLEQHRLFRDRLVLLLRRDHELARARTVTWSALKPYGLIALKNTSSVRHLVERAYAQQGTPLRPTFEVEYATTLISFVARGLGIGVLPYSLAPLAESRELMHRRIERPEIYRTLCVITLKSRTLSPAAAAFVAACTDQAAARRGAARAQHPAGAG